MGEILWAILGVLVVCLLEVTFWMKSLLLKLSGCTPLATNILKLKITPRKGHPSSKPPFWGVSLGVFFWGADSHLGLMIIYEWGDVVRNWGVQYISQELDRTRQ